MFSYIICHVLASVLRSRPAIWHMHMADYSFQSAILDRWHLLSAANITQLCQRYNGQHYVLQAALPF